ncbi:uncharacterized protein [Mytilus edulis]|uniref:uncharacterized protein n=1 Tax=Mytilus edulis TaxID=6550 RepID=UPI0039EFD03D
MDTLWISEFLFLYFQCLGIPSMQVAANCTRLSTFETDLGDWIVVSSINTTWQRSVVLKDHTRLSSARRGYTINAFSWNGKAGTTRIDTDRKFMEPICLSFWYQFYRNSSDCFFSIYKITDGNKFLLFTVDSKSTLFNTWIKKSVNVYARDPFRITLEAYFKQRTSTEIRLIVIDDTSIQYRPCEYNFQTPPCVEIAAESNTTLGDNFQTTHRSEISAEYSTTLGGNNHILKKSNKAGILVIILSVLVVLIVAAIVIIMIVCIRKKRAKNSKQCRQTQHNTTAARVIDSSDYNVIHYDEMTDISIRKTTQHQPQSMKTSSEQDENICNEYESVSTKRTSVEHIYESDSIPINQYESLTNQRELDKHTYESTEQALLQSMKTSIEQDDNICNRYESLSTNRNPAEHMYELDSIPISHYQSLKQQQKFDEHIYESTEHALPVLMNQELSQYESLTQPPESDKHVYASALSQQ